MLVLLILYRLSCFIIRCSLKPVEARLKQFRLFISDLLVFFCNSVFISLNKFDFYLSELLVFLC